MNGRSLGHRGNAGGQATSVDRGGAVLRREAESPGCTADEPLDALSSCISISRLSEDFTCYLAYVRTLVWQATGGKWWCREDRDRWAAQTVRACNRAGRDRQPETKNGRRTHDAITRKRRPF